MSAIARIAQLHRELAEAYDALDREQPGKLATKRTPARPVVPVESQPSKETIDGVRRRLRRIGVKTT